jgi:uncharacterized protein
MIYSKISTTLITIALTFGTTASCQVERSKSQEHQVNFSADSLQSFRNAFWKNLPKPKAYVNDYEDLYTDKEEKSLDSLISSFEKSTTIEIAVVTIDTLMTSADSLDAFTLLIAKTWGVGKKDKNNGVLIGICRGYRKMRIQNGFGIEKILTDTETKQIVDTAFIPGFRGTQYFEGTLKGLTTIMAKLKERSK